MLKLFIDWYLPYFVRHAPLRSNRESGAADLPKTRGISYPCQNRGGVVQTANGENLPFGRPEISPLTSAKQLAAVVLGSLSAIALLVGAEWVIERDLRRRRHGGEACRGPRQAAAPQPAESHVAAVQVKDVADDAYAPARRDREEVLKTIFNTALEAIITIDESGKMESANPAAERMFGYSKAEMLGRNISMLMPSPDRERHNGYLGSYLRTGERKMIGNCREVIGMRRDGSLFPLDLSVSEVQLSDRRIFAGLLRDTTQQKQEERALATRATQQQAVAELGQHALEGGDLEHLMTDAVALVAQILDVEYSKVFELAPSGEHFLLRAGVGWNAGCVGRLTMAASEPSLAAYTVLHGTAVIENYDLEKRFPRSQIQREHGVVSAAAVIIQARERPYGVLTVDSTRQRSFGQEDVHFLQSIANVLGAGIERRRLEDELLAATGQEQRRIGQDLHDGLCQHLAGVEFRTEALARDLVDNATARTEVMKIAALIREGTRQARMLSRSIIPVELAENGLMAALQELAASIADLHRISCLFCCEGSVFVTDNAAATHLYRIAQEAISNAIRHARAKTIEIELRQTGDEGMLTVANDGAPFPAAEGRCDGMGLRIMRYRAGMIGAKLRIGSTPDGKTAVICLFKLAS